MIRWNALAIVLRANKESTELGGHIASFQSAATLYDIGSSMVLARAATRATAGTSSTSRGTRRRGSTRGRSWRAA